MAGATRHFTLYLDESGLFVRPSDPEQGLGLRVVGGCVLPGSPDEHHAAVADALDAALDWWTGERHALHLRNHVKVAFGLRAAARAGRGLPGPLTEQGRALAALPASRVPARAQGIAGLLRDAGDRLLTRALRVLAAHHAAVVLCVEDDQRPAAPRYPAMGAAAFTRALWTASSNAEGDVRLDVVVAQGGAGGTAWTGDLSSIAARVGRRLGRAVELGCVEVADALDAARRPALFLADAITHVCGPRGQQQFDLTPEQRADWTGERLRARVRSYCGEVPVALTSGLLQPAVDRWLDGADDAATAGMLAEASGPGHLPAVVDELRRALGLDEERPR